MKEKILELRATGKTYQQIADELDCAKSTVAYHCSEEQRDKTGQRRRDRRSKFRKKIEELKTGVPCMDCGLDFPHFVLQFDHRPGTTKVYAISSDVNKFKNMQDLLDEVAKCDVVCANCHALRTWQRKTSWYLEDELVGN